MSAEALARIDAALSNYRHDHPDGDGDCDGSCSADLVAALRAARALIPEPPTDDEREAVRKANGQLSIERLREIGNAATPGPWTYDGYGADEPEINAWAHRYIRNTDADASGLYREIATSEDGHGPNAEFIVHARNFWDELLDELAMWRNRHRGPITDEMVEAGCAGFYNAPNGLTSWNRLARVDPALADKYRAGMRVALEAAEVDRA